MGCLFILLLLFINPFFCHASVVLNEIYPAPPTGETEWVELYNNENKNITLSQYRLFDLVGNEIKISTDSAPPFGFVLATSFGVLNNDGDTVRLKNLMGEILEIATYSGSFTSSKTFAKCPNGENNWFILTTPTKNSSNETTCQALIPTPTLSPPETPTPIPTSEPTQAPSPTPLLDYRNIYISEVFPYPQTGEHEWIELYNDNDLQISLDHWYIDDGENTGSAPKSFSLTINPYTYTSVDITSSMFNNTGDTVRFLDSAMNEKDSMEYGKIAQGKSMGRISFSEDSYCEQESSKNAPNSLCLSEPTQSTSLQSSAQNSVNSPQTIVPTKKLINQHPQQKNTIPNSINSTSSQQVGEVLGVQTKEAPPASPTPYLSFTSFSYSLLTIVSLFIKMKNA